MRRIVFLFRFVLRAAPVFHYVASWSLPANNSFVADGDRRVNARCPKRWNRAGNQSEQE